MTGKVKKLVLLNLPYLIFVYLFDKLCQGVRLAPGADASEKLLHIGQGFSAAFASLAPSFHLVDLCVGAAGAVLIRLVVYSKGKNAKKYRRGIEYGSARWGTPADIAPYMDKDFSQNVLLTQTERITMSSRPKEPKYARNKNILVCGGSGSGKTRFFVKPNLLQCHSSYVVTDPKGTILNEVGALLDRKGYRIKSLNLINFKKSMRYNPLAYIRSEKDILKLVNALILNTKGEGEKSSEDFWVKAERLYYSALIGYIWYEAEPEERNFITLLDLISASEAREDDEEFQSPVDLLFAKLEKEHPDHFAVKQYRKFKMAAGVVCSKRLLNQAVGKSLRTHNLKPKKGAQVMKKNEKITALYERLSRDDFGKDDDQQRESNSISNQELLLALSDQKDKDEKRIDDILDELNLTIYKERHPMSLSGGQKQRTAIGVAALRDAEVLIFDEPTSGLDYKNMESVAGILSALSKRGKAILVISHDNELLMKICSRVIRVDERTSS